MKGKTPIFQAPLISEHLVPSVYIEQRFKIKIQLPMRRADGSERFPVVYATDSDDFFGGLANLSTIMQAFGETPRYILVGIGYDNPGASESLRMRDLFTHSIRSLYQREIEGIFESDFVSGLDDIRTVTATTDAHDFLCFIRQELIPFVNANYPTVAEDRSYYGYSAGGAFGLFALFKQSDTFQRYVLGSPATSFDANHFGIELAKEFLASGKTVNAKVFMSVGELEEFTRGYGQFELVTGYYRLVKFLKQSAIDGLALTSQVFPGETHATAWTQAFSHGLRALFGPASQVPYWPE